MPRQRRIWFPGAQYHIMCRGNRKNVIYKDFEDYNMYLIFLERTKKKYPFELLSYCLMPNHVHLQIKCRDDSISLIMKHLNQLYSVYFNNRHELVGHIFQGRYKSVLIEDTAAMLRVSCYIHLNPVKAGLCDRAEDWMWSSRGV